MVAGLNNDLLDQKKDLFCQFHRIPSISDCLSDGDNKESPHVLLMASLITIKKSVSFYGIVALV